MRELGVLGHAEYKVSFMLDHRAMITVQTEKYGEQCLLSDSVTCWVPKFLLWQACKTPVGVVSSLYIQQVFRVLAMMAPCNEPLSSAAYRHL